MSEPLRLTPHASRDTDQPADAWLWLNAAARRSGLSEAHLRRQAPAWAAKGLARQMQTSNGRLAWQVHESADGRLARVRSVETMDAHADLTRYTEAQRTEILRRKRLVLGWDAARAGAVALGLTEEVATTRYLAQLAATEPQPPTRSTLYRWRESWRRSGLVGLADARWGGGGGGGGGGTKGGEGRRDEGAEVYRDVLLRVYLDQRGRSIRLSHELAAEAALQAGQTPPAYATAKRIIASLDPAAVTLAREGRSAYQDAHEPYIERDYSSIPSNAWWCADHHRLDVLVVVGRNPDGSPIHQRPWLHAWQDLRSRLIVGWRIVAHDPNADLILATVAEAMRRHGVPERAYIDNGRDFDARSLQGLTKRQRRSEQGLTPADRTRLGGACGLLGIAVTHAWPYHGQSKPIERFFGTVCDRFSRTIETYCGSSPDDKPEDLQRHLDAGHAPTLAELRDAFGRWVADGYNARVHLGDSMHGRSPEQVHAEAMETRRTLPDELVRFACMPRVGPVVVRQNGVHYEQLSFGRSDPELARRYGDRVWLAIDVDDLSSVLVLDEQQRLICRAALNERLPFGADKQQLRQAIAEKRSMVRRARVVAAERPRRSLDVPQLLLDASARAAAATRAATPPADPAPASMAAAHLGEHLADLQRLAPPALRQAAGGEHQPPHPPHPFNDPAPAPALPSIFSYQRRPQEDSDE